MSSHSTDLTGFRRLALPCEHGERKNNTNLDSQSQKTSQEARFRTHRFSEKSPSQDAKTFTPPLGSSDRWHVINVFQRCIKGRGNVGTTRLTHTTFP